MKKVYPLLIILIITIVGKSRADCPYPGDQMIRGAQVTLIESGTNGANQKLAYFQIPGCDEYFAFLVSDDVYGKLWYSTILTAITTGYKIDFWANPTVNTYIPGYSSLKGRGIDRLRINMN